MKRIIIPAILSVFIGTIACKKETTPSPAPTEKNARLAIKLNSNYLAPANVDSAILLWEINGKVQQETMQLSNDTLFTALNKLDAGNGRLTVQVFSNINVRNRKLQWEKRTELEVKQNQSVNLDAPLHYDDPDWYPRVIMVDEPTKFTAIVALRPGDPYFLLKNVPAGYKIELERNYVATPGGARIVGGGLWKCNTVCTDERGMIENREFFIPLPAQIREQEWKMVEVGIGLFGPNYSSGPGFYFNHY
ncbi:MAG TPA: hypothetical protein VGN63_09230 [Flavisolibacter sp.]|jgi:hypothetical protein|nr:hypothetical protein [Flavisolibacter sp.]